MPNGTLHDGIMVDFTDVLLIINTLAIAMLLGVLYIDAIMTAVKRVAHAMNPRVLLARIRFWRAASRTPH